MVDQNEITGARLVSKVTTKKYADNWNKIFKKQGITLTEEELANVEIIADIVQHHHHDKKQTIKPISDAIAYDSDSSNDNLPPNYDSRSSYTREST